MDFKAWSLDMSDQKCKAEYYPSIDKKDAFDLGYIAEYSGHSRGSTVDLTLINIKTHSDLDMGSRVDMMDVISHITCTSISDEAKKNRLLLRLIMQKYGFEPYDQEWWHFTLIDEPFKRTPQDHFNFPVN